MSQKETVYQYNNEPIVQRESGITSRNFLPNVFLWMFIALALSAGFAWSFSSDDALLSMLIDTETGGRTTLGTVAMFAPLAFVLVMSFGMNRLSFPVLALICSLLLIKSRKKYLNNFIIFSYSFMIILFTELAVRYTGINNIILFIFILLPFLLLIGLYFYLNYAF